MVDGFRNRVFVVLPVNTAYPQLVGWVVRRVVFVYYLLVREGLQIQEVSFVGRPWEGLQVERGELLSVPVGFIVGFMGRFVGGLI